MSVWCCWSQCYPHRRTHPENAVWNGAVAFPWTQGPPQGHVGAKLQAGKVQDRRDLLHSAISTTCKHSLRHTHTHAVLHTHNSSQTWHVSQVKVQYQLYGPLQNVSRERPKAALFPPQWNIVLRNSIWQPVRVSDEDGSVGNCRWSALHCCAMHKPLGPERGKRHSVFLRNRLRETGRLGLQRLVHGEAVRVTNWV